MLHDKYTLCIEHTNLNFLFTQAVLKAIPKFQEGMAKIGCEVENTIQEVANFMRQRFNEKVKMQNLKAEMLFALLNRFQEDYKAHIFNVEVAQRSQLLNRIVEKRQTITRLSHEADIVVDVLLDTDLNPPCINFNELFGVLHFDENKLLNGNESESEMEKESESESEEESETETANEGARRTGDGGQSIGSGDGGSTVMPSTSSSVSAATSGGGGEDGGGGGEGESVKRKLTFQEGKLAIKKVKIRKQTADATTSGAADETRNTRNTTNTTNTTNTSQE